MVGRRQKVCVGLMVRTHTHISNDDGSNYDARTIGTTHTLLRTRNDDGSNYVWQ